MDKSEEYNEVKIVYTTFSDKMGNLGNEIMKIKNNSQSYYKITFIQGNNFPNNVQLKNFNIYKSKTLPNRFIAYYEVNNQKIAKQGGNRIITG